MKTIRVVAAGIVREKKKQKKEQSKKKKQPKADICNPERIWRT